MIYHSEMSERAVFLNCTTLQKNVAYHVNFYQLKDIVNLRIYILLVRAKQSMLPNNLQDPFYK